MTPQEILTKSVTRLRKQGRPALAADGTGKEVCKYLTEDGLCCAVGVLLPKEDYLLTYEGDVSDLYFDAPEAREFLGEENKPLLYALQNVHDLGWADGTPFPEDRFREIAEAFGLKYPEPEE